jgi:hypothetical protein
MVVLLCILASFLNGKQYRTDEFGSYDAKFTWNFSVCTCIYNLHVLATYQFSSGVKIIFRSFRIAEENSVAHNVECRELYCVKVSIMMTFEVNKSHPKLYHLRRSGFKYKYIPLARTHAHTKCFKISMNSKFPFKIHVNHLTYKCCPVLGMRLIIALTWVK